jgi:hypothetical protein
MFQPALKKPVDAKRIYGKSDEVDPEKERNVGIPIPQRCEAYVRYK